MRLAIAVLASVFALNLLVVSVTLLIGEIRHPYLPNLLSASFWASAIVAIVVGLPNHFVLARFNRQRRRNYAVAGILAGVLFAVVTEPFGVESYLIRAIIALQFGVLGAAAACVFWRIAVP